MPRSGYIETPVWREAALAGLLLGVTLLGGAAGISLDGAFEIAGISTGFLGLKLGATAMAIFFGLRLSRALEFVDKRWKASTAKRLGFSHLPLDRLMFATLLPGRTAYTLRDVGLLAESRGALVFLGYRESMIVIPFAGMIGALYDGFMAAPWARLLIGEEDVKAHRWILVREGGENAWGRSAATMALVDRVNVKTGSSKFLSELSPQQAQAFEGLSLRTLPERLSDFGTIAARLFPEDSRLAERKLKAAGRRIVVLTIYLLLHEQSWNLKGGAGGMTRVSKDDIDVDLEQLLDGLSQGTVSPDDWRSIWEAADVADDDLGAFVESMRKVESSG